MFEAGTVFFQVKLFENFEFRIFRSKFCNFFDAIGKTYLMRVDEDKHLSF